MFFDLIVLHVFYVQIRTVVSVHIHTIIELSNNYLIVFTIMKLNIVVLGIMLCIIIL